MWERSAKNNTVAYFVGSLSRIVLSLVIIGFMMATTLLLMKDVVYGATLYFSILRTLSAYAPLLLMIKRNLVQNHILMLFSTVLVRSFALRIV